MINAESLAALEQVSRSLEDLLNRQPGAAAAASAAAKALHGAWPGARGYVCALGAERGGQVAALGRGGKTLADVQKRLGDPSAAWDKELAGLGTPVVARDGPATLALVLDRSASAAEAALAGLWLTSLARLLALHALRREAQALREDVEALESLANVGELAGVVAHEFTDFLNVLLLQLAVLEARLPASEREDLATIRRHGERASDVLNRFQEYRRSPAGGGGRTDLAEVVGRITERLGLEAECVAVSLADKKEEQMASSPDGVLLLRDCPSDAWVAGRPADVRRLVRFLVSNGVRASAQGGRRVVVAIEPGSAGPRLRVEVSVPPPPDVASALFDSTVPALDGVDQLELAACRSLARRLRCSLTAEGSEDGLRLRAEFPG